jgi:RHS repeat-associated protein
LGDSTNSFSYDAYGTVTKADATDENTTLFTGREDDSTGVLYYRVRHYDPKLGRFLSEDPLGLAAGDANLYRYVRNDPLNATDPTGQCVWILVPVCAMGGREAIIAISSAVIASAAGAVCGMTGCMDAFFAEHTKNKQGKNWDKHTGPAQSRTLLKFEVATPTAPIE